MSDHKPKADFKAIYKQVQENQNRIEACSKHKFTEEPPFAPGQRFCCVNCGGFVPAVEAFRYVQGYIAAGGNPNDIMEGW